MRVDYFAWGVVWQWCGRCCYGVVVVVIGVVVVGIVIGVVVVGVVAN